MTDLTPERLAELRRIAEAAVPGKWSWQDFQLAMTPRTALALLDEIERLQRIEQAAKRVATMHRYDHRRVAGLCGCSLCALHVALDSEKGGAGE